jgi:hypothetical protein
MYEILIWAQPGQDSLCLLTSVLECPFSALNSDFVYVMRMLYSVRVCLVKCFDAVNGAMGSGHCRVRLDVDVFSMSSLTQILGDSFHLI